MTTFSEVFHEINANTPPLTPELTKIMNCTLLQSLETEILGVKEIPVLGEIILTKSGNRDTGCQGDTSSR